MALSGNMLQQKHLYKYNIDSSKIAFESILVQQSDVTDNMAKVWPNLRAKLDDEMCNADEAGLKFSWNIMATNKTFSTCKPCNKL